MNFEPIGRCLVEGCSWVIIISAFLGFLPSLAAGVSLLWYGLLFYDKFFKKK